MKQFLSPPRVAEILGCGVEKVHAYINRGELRAINTSLGDRPRYKIDPDDFDAFCESRASQKPQAAQKRRSVPKASKDYV
ncbi:MAG: helix-turn-helix domain-containing protein [Pirellula sp.]|jgi:excisionase family DNA binding protein